MKKISTVRVNGNMIFKGHKRTIGLDLGDLWSFYCVRDKIRSCRLVWPHSASSKTYFNSRKNASALGWVGNV